MLNLDLNLWGWATPGGQSATVWYVQAADEGGTGDGLTPETAWQTFANIPTDGTIAPGHTLDGLGDTYAEAFTKIESGTAGKYITYRNMEIAGAATLADGFTGTDKSFVKLRNITSKDCIDNCISFTDSHDIQLYDCVGETAGESSIVFFAAGSDCYNIFVTNSETRYAKHGIRFYSASSGTYQVRNSSIISNTIDYCGQDGINVAYAASDILIGNNDVSEIGYAAYGDSPEWGTGIELWGAEISHPTSVIIENNKVYDIHDIELNNDDGLAIRFDDYVTGSTARYNECFNLDNSGIGDASKHGEGNTIHHNLIYNFSLLGNDRTAGVKITNYTSGTPDATPSLIYNNIIANGKRGVWADYESYSITVTNNIIVDCDYGIVQNNTVSNNTRMVENYNNIYNSVIYNMARETSQVIDAELTLDSTDITTDPQLTPTFRYYTGSPCIGAGVAVGYKQGINPDSVWADSVTLEDYESTEGFDTEFGDSWDQEFGSGWDEPFASTSYHIGPWSRY